MAEGLEDVDVSYKIPFCVPHCLTYESSARAFGGEMRIVVKVLLAEMIDATSLGSRLLVSQYGPLAPSLLPRLSVMVLLSSDHAASSCFLSSSGIMVEYTTLSDYF